MQNTAAVQSPPFGYLSPPIDGCDALSEDGDTLRTPLTDHVEHHQPYAVYHQNQHHFSHLFHTSSPAVQDDDGPAKPHQQGHQECAHYSDLLTPSASERLSSTVDTYFANYVSPPHALDLANASLEFDPFAASFASTFAQDAISTCNKDPATYDFLLHHPAHPSLGQITEEDITSAASASTSMGHLSALPSLSVSADSLDLHFNKVQCTNPDPSFLLDPVTINPSVLASTPEDITPVGNINSHPSPRPSIARAPASENVLLTKARLFSPRFPADHSLNPFFARTYHLGDELGAGGYGFVMTARHRFEGHEVAVKFIIKDKVPEHAWWDDELLGRVPTEVMIMSLVNHENIVKCVDLYEDERYFYLVQELHGTPWISRKKSKTSKQITAPGKLVVPSPSLSTPALTPSPSADLADPLLSTPPQLEVTVEQVDTPLADENKSLHMDMALDCKPHQDQQPAGLYDTGHSPSTGDDQDMAIEQYAPPTYLEPPAEALARPNFSRRPSYDLFECIEQSKHKRLSENHARYIFAQVVEAVHYLDSQGITHCDIKDENLVIDADFKVKLIDFGSAVVADPYQTRPFYTLFFGTTAYASSEILRKRPYQAPPAEVWTLGVLLSYLLTGHSPFPTEQDAIEGRVVVRERGGASKLSRGALSLMGRCLARDPERRATIDEIRGHRWLQGALDRERLVLEDRT